LRRNVRANPKTRNRKKTYRLAMLQTTITEDMTTSFQGVIPATLATVSLSGIPNVTYISQVHFIDETHLGISRQFFSKTWANISENPHFSIVTTCPETFSVWKTNLSFEEEFTEGSIFDEMNMVIKAIASIQGMESVFKLQSAVVCKVESVEILIAHGKIK